MAANLQAAGQLSGQASGRRIHPDDLSQTALYVEDRWQQAAQRLRAAGPVAWMDDSDYGPYWSVHGHQAIQHVEALPELYSSSWEYGGITISERRADVVELTLPMFIAMDRPQHTGQRRTVAPKFTPSKILEIQADVRRRTAEVLDSLPWDQQFDWVDRVSVELTTQMLAILFDFPWEDRRKLSYWSDWAGDVEIGKDPVLSEQRLQILYEMGAYFQKLWDERLNAPPADDLLSMMIHSDSMNHMGLEEFIGNLVLLIVGGNDTTRNTMSGIAYGLHSFPDQRALLEGDPSLIENAVQEIIRWQTPLAHMRRTATADAELFGHAVKQGDKLVMWYVSANRDDAVFDQPEAIMLDRPNARRHLAFGYGIHRCMGARLAEMQIAVLLDEMAKRRMRVIVDEEPERVAACFVHGYRKMMVHLEKY